MRRLSAPEFDAVETHVAECAHCRARTQEWGSFITAVRDAAPLAARRRVLAPPRWQWAWAASFLLCFAGFLWLRPSLGKPAVVTVETWRGEEVPSSQAPARRPLTLQLREPTARPGAGFEARLVDAAGVVQVAGRGRVDTGGLVRWETGHALAPGLYWVRLYRDRALVREFALRVD